LIERLLGNNNADVEIMFLWRSSSLALDFNSGDCIWIIKVVFICEDYRDEQT